MPLSDIPQGVSPGPYRAGFAERYKTKSLFAPAPMPVTLISKSAMPLPLVSPVRKTAGQAKLAGSPGEARPADEVEGLVAAGRRIGVDGLQVDLVVLGMAKALDQIVVSADPAFYRLIEVEGVLAGAADLHVAAETADQQVVAVLALEQVLAALAEELVVAEPALDLIEAGTAMDDVVAGEPVDQSSPPRPLIGSPRL